MNPMPLTADSFILGEKFIGLADFQYVVGEPLNLTSLLPIIYADTHDVTSLFKAIDPNQPFVLISHNSDGVVADYDKKFCANIRRKPPQLKKWFAQNVIVDDPIVTTLPIGLENSKWFKQVRKQERLLKMRNKRQTHINTLYINHNVRTNPHERLEPYTLFEDAIWCTCRVGKNGIDYQKYIEDIRSHTFVLCPDGNGPDTHRVWETLYLGSIPLVKRGPHHQVLDGLPVLFVDNWSEVNEDRLLEFSAKAQQMEFDWYKLDMGYWERVIREQLLELRND